MTGDDTAVAAVRSVLTSLRKRAGLLPERLGRTEIDAGTLIDQPVIGLYADYAGLSAQQAVLPVIREMARNLTPTDRLIVDVELNLGLLKDAPPPGVDTADLYADDLGARRSNLCKHWTRLHHDVPSEDIPATPTVRTIRGPLEEKAFTELARLLVEGSAYGAVLPTGVTDRSDSAPRVVVIGDAVVDHLYRVEQMPVSGESVWGRRAVHPGGKGLNRAVAVAEFGLPVALLAAVGDDDAGHGLRNYLRDKRVNTSLVKTVERTPTPVTAVIVSTETGEQAVIADKDERMTLSDIDIGSPAVQAAISEADALLCTFEQPVRVLAGLLDVVRELAHRPRLFVHASPPLPQPQSLYPYLPMIDFLIGSAAELDALVSHTGTGSTAASTEQRLRVAGVRGVCRLENFGCTVRSDYGDFDIPPFPSMLGRSPGAPAAFAAALTYRLLGSPRPPDRADFVWATAAMVATQSLDSVPESMPRPGRIDHIVRLTPDPGSEDLRGAV